MTQEWRAMVTWRHTSPADERLSTLTTGLPGYGIVIQDGDTLRAEMTVDGATLRQATDAAMRAARTAYAAAFGTAGDPVELRVLTVEAYDLEVARPRPVQLVGLSEAAEMLGISPQRVDQLARDNPRFPAPLARLAMGPVFTRASIEVARDVGWRRPPGRPRKTT